MREINQHLPEIRCAHCGRKLGEGYVLALSIKCPRCGAYNTLRAARPDSELRDSHTESDRDKIYS